MRLTLTTFCIFFCLFDRNHTPSFFVLKHNRGTWQYDDSCDNVYLFCDVNKNSTCQFKTCSNSDYISGWDEKAFAFPSRCNSKERYCPDNGSQCTPLVETGGHCEPQRDDECAGGNSICLNSTCFVKVSPLGGHCGSDRTDYISYNENGDAVQQIIIRDNCTDGTYCGPQFECVLSKPLNAHCEQDRECLSNTCADDGICRNAPDLYHRIATWLWAVTGCFILVFILVILGMLWLLHRYQSRKEHEKFVRFFEHNEEFNRLMLTADYQDHKEKMHPTHHSQPLEAVSKNSSVVYLATPDYHESAALANHHTTPTMTTPNSIRRTN
ncbi:hypothetical protein BDF20DRAFT_818589 [Mycotypha africana]|uniref:uncharacterized protein n=1 Tax=Mycotypha africana TaxID=64632 RepID=UPI00230161D9|nr:uncharacterized protein BDF20DRAFT_818589 [Mycotypha africana]KAI8981773.1 hypothetical protein BDF20DRAFT_818589 [Mycotypha africana]